MVHLILKSSHLWAQWKRTALNNISLCTEKKKSYINLKSQGKFHKTFEENTMATNHSLEKCHWIFNRLKWSRLLAHEKEKLDCTSSPNPCQHSSGTSWGGISSVIEMEKPKHHMGVLLRAALKKVWKMHRHHLPWKWIYLGAWSSLLVLIHVACSKPRLTYGPYIWLIMSY